MKKRTRILLHEENNSFPLSSFCKAAKMSWLKLSREIKLDSGAQQSKQLQFAEVGNIVEP